MALTVKFWSSFQKKTNSTAIPGGDPARTLSCTLKSESSILSPTLEVFGSYTINPYDLTYAQIVEYNRYYWVGDWQWSEGRWFCPLSVDPLASFRTPIGAAEKYVLRSAYAHDPNIADTLYPAKTWAVDEKYTADFGWAASISAGFYILGVLNYQTADDGSPVTYYRMGADEIRNLLAFMLPQDGGGWTGLTSWANTSLIKAIYDPTQYIVSCKWFPYPVYAKAQSSLIPFGNYDSTAVGHVLNDPSNWYPFQQDIALPAGWLARKGRERVNPYCHVYLKINPWGVIELDPADLSRTTTIRLRVSPDYISGDALLEVLTLEGSAATLIYQSSAKASLDIQLANTASNLSGIIGGLAKAVGAAAAGVGAEAGIAKAAAALTSAGGVADAAGSISPSLSRSGGLTGGIVVLDGKAELRIRTSYFAAEAPDELGRPLFDNRILSSIPGYMKLADGDFQAAGAYEEELRQIGEYFTGGFYYE